MEMHLGILTLFTKEVSDKGLISVIYNGTNYEFGFDIRTT